MNELDEPAANLATDAFHQLEPNALLDAIDSTGHRTDGRFSALNSYENRVYSVGLEDGSWLVSKFYRPGRWSDDAILEEHAFCRRLAEYELPVIAPLADAHGETLFRQGPYRFCLFERVGGRAPELDSDAQLELIGRTVARLHAVAEHHPFHHRPSLSVARLGDASAGFLLESPLLPEHHVDVYASLVDELLPMVDERLEHLDDLDILSLHGDLHPGNLLLAADGTPMLLDFDDTMTGPAIQDLWMFLSGERDYAEARLAALLDGYLEFRDFDLAELDLVEPLRTLRIIHYAAWIGRRWDDPAFRQAFPFFDSERFWDEHILSLREQMAMLEEAPLAY
ncbi:MAG: serine/threonine protein kinase [Gammaproteobacteria bacterium]|nr:MAG: serine/threonine protein kinase [Gammaproteobacteria bacterium]